MLCSKYRVSEDKMRSVKAPEFTETWSPVSHGTLVDMVKDCLAKKNFVVARQEFSLMGGEDEKMFGVLDFEEPRSVADPNPTSLSLGIRNSIDKTLSAGICGGARVFVCDNLAFSGEVTFFKKHDKEIEQAFPLMVEQAITDLTSKHKDQKLPLFEQWKSQEVSLESATNFIVETASGGGLPQKGILRVRDIFRYPPFDAFRDKTVWSLYNAFSYYARSDRGQINPLDAANESIRQFSAFKHSWPLATAV